mmetsp:Transcript_1643/g.4842  ORF Transcript_1643/g.4842 Transcript_1643/m.4842 type:complete len:211 (-) Transcript_1643:183-815(-)
MRSTLRTHEQDKSQALQAADVCASEDGTRSAHMESMDSMRTLQDHCRDKWQAQGVARASALQENVWIRTDVTNTAVASCLTADAEATLPETDADPQLLGLELGCLTGQEDGAAAEVERQEEAARPRRRHPKGLQCGPRHLQGCEAAEHREDGCRQVQPSEQQRHSERELSQECQATSRCLRRGIADVGAARAVWLFGARLAARSQPGAVR